MRSYRSVLVGMVVVVTVAGCSEPTAERGGRRKKLYELTPIGLAAVRHSLADLRCMAKGLKLELEMP